MTRGSRLKTELWPALIAGITIVLDRISKLWIRHSMSSFDSVPVIPGWLRIVHTENPGAAFGVLADGNPLVRSSILIGVSALVMVFVAAALWKRGSSFQTMLTRFGVALVLGGAVGNLYDRIVRGMVTDFIEVYHGAWSFPAFNVADSAITIGAALLLLDLGRPHKKVMTNSAELAGKP